MKCSRCAADLQDATAFCPKCGTSITGQLAPVMFSYLPAGAPPWPSTVPPKPVYATTPSTTTLITGITPPAKPPRSPRKVAMTLASVILAPLLGVGIMLAVLTSQGLFPPGAASQSKITTIVQPTTTAATPATQGNQLPTPTSFKTTTSTDLKVALQYPSDWTVNTPQVSADGSSRLDILAAQQIGIDFLVLRRSDISSSTYKSADDVNKNILTGLQGSSTVHNLQSVPPPSTNQPTIADTTWSESDVVFMDDNISAQMHFTAISVQHTKVYYTIAFYIPGVYYTEAMQKYIQHMLSSFQFVS